LAVVVVKESTVLAVVKKLSVVVVKESTVVAVVKELAVVVVVVVVTFVLPLDDLEKPMMMFAVDASQKI
jgi:hypothetical protein